jgi:hypothetical protein
VTTVESIVKSTASPFALPVVTYGAALTGSWTADDLGRDLTVAHRNRTSIAPMVAVKGSALLPISDVVVFDGVAGFRSWSPPV